MLLGHYASALLGKRAAPSIPLWALFAAGQAVDIGWSLLVLLGIERVRIVPGFTASNPLDLAYMPYTHSLAATVIWGLAAGLLWARRGGAREGLAFGAVVASHWLLDLLVHVPDLPIAAGDGPKLGLGLWNHRWLAATVETGFVAAAGVVAWPLLPPARVRLLAILVGLSIFGYVAPAPASSSAVAASGLGFFVAMCWLAWRFERASGSSVAEGAPAPP
jgi:hypothetical protein